MKRLVETSSFVKGLGQPKLFAFALFQMFGYSQVQFVAQLRPPCRALRRIELQIIRDLIGGPGLWAPAELFYHLAANKLFPKDLKACDVLCRAAMLKTMLRSLPDWEDDYIELIISERGLYDALSFPNQQWWENLAVVNLKRASEEFHQESFEMLYGSVAMSTGQTVLTSRSVCMSSCYLACIISLSKSCFTTSFPDGLRWTSWRLLWHTQRLYATSSSRRCPHVCCFVL